MDTKKFNKLFDELIEIRNELYQTEYNSTKYDELEEDMADLEDEIMEEFGDKLDEVIEAITHSIAPDTDPAHPMAYLAKSYTPSEFVPGEFEINTNDGIRLNSTLKDENGKPMKGRLIWLPAPARLVFTSSSDIRVLWTSDKPEEIFLD